MAQDAGTERLLTSEAARLWQKGEYKDCLQALERLRLTRPQDIRVGHNHALATFFRKDTPDAKVLQEELHSLKESGDSSSEAAVLEEAVLLLNTASILYNSNQSAAAVKLLEPLFASISHVAEEPALGISFLLLDIYLAEDDRGKAASVVAHLESRYGLQPVKSDEAGTDSNSASPPEQNHGGTNGQSNHLPPLERVAEHVWVGCYNVSQLVPGYRARLNLLNKNLKAAKRDIKASLTDDPHQALGLSLKAELEARRWNLRRAAKLVTPHTSTTQSQSESPALSRSERVNMLCNVGFIQHCEGKHQAAALCFSNALKLCADGNTPLQALGSEVVQPAAVVTQDSQYAITYNTGLQALQLKQYDAALHCFQGAMEMFQKPLLWLRMAECCMGAAVANQPLSNAQADQQDKGKAEASIAATLEYGGQCAANALFLCSQHGAEEQHADILSMSSTSRGVDMVANMANREFHPGSSPLQGLEHSTKADVKVVRTAALGAAAFLALQQGQPAAALQHAQELIAATEPGSETRQLAQNYASEALRLLGRAPEAALQLQAALAESLVQPSTPPGRATQHDLPIGSADDLELLHHPPKERSDAVSARVALLVNLASVYFSIGDFPQAEEFATAGVEYADSQDALLMHVLLQMCKGNSSVALDILRHHQLGTYQGHT